MNRIRFNIAGLLIVVLFVAEGFAALRESTELWDSGLLTMTLMVLLCSILLAIHRHDARRAFWVGFALFGAGYLALSLIPSIESRLMTTKGLAYLDSTVPGRPQSFFTSHVQRSGEPTGDLKPRHSETLGCNDRQAPRRLGWYDREFREDRALADRIADGLAGWAALSPSLASLQTGRIAATGH
jgi:hypothetical protein